MSEVTGSGPGKILEGQGTGGGRSTCIPGRRPSTAPTHTDGKVVMRRLGLDSADPPSVVFEPGFSRLQTRRVILDR